MDSLFWKRRLALIAFVSLFVVSFGALAGAVPSITPVSVQPMGPASGGGVVTRVTYQLGPAANGVPGEAANAASYLTRPVTISGPTMGGIVRGVVKGGLRLAGWVGAAMLAYDVYKWYTDSSGQLMQPGESFPSVSCGPGDPYFSFGNASGYGCSVPAAIRDLKSRQVAAWTANGYSNVSVDADGCVPGSEGSNCPFSYTVWHTCCGGSSQPSNYNDFVYWSKGTVTTVDPAYVTDPAPVTDSQLGDLAQQHPEWWPDMLRDQQTGQPIVTPEIASDMQALQDQLAAQAGVDPTTLPQVQPDPEYQFGKATPREQAMPDFCAWASAACDYFKFAEDNWPDKQGDKQVTDSADCVTPPSCSGDEVMCAVVRNTWAGKCATAGDPNVTRPTFGDHKVAELDQGEVDVGDPSQLDKAGFGWGGGSCPFTDLSVEFGGRTVSVSAAPVCEYGPWMRAFILILAGLKCAEIMAGLRVAAE